MAIILQYPFGRIQLTAGSGGPEWSPISDISSEELVEPANTLIAVHSRHFTLIPDSYFDPEDTTAYLRQLGMPAQVGLAVNAIPEWQANLVFSLERLPEKPGNTEQILSLWRGLLFAAHVLSVQEKSPGLLVHITPGQVYLLGFEENDLQFFNSFPTRDIHDLLFFMLHGLDQWGKSPVHLPVFLSGHFTIDSPLFELIQGYFGTIRIVSPEVFRDLPETCGSVGHQFFDLCSFVMCESSAEN